jgi:hypothetical protein
MHNSTRTDGDLASGYDGHALRHREQKVTLDQEIDFF